MNIGQHVHSMLYSMRAARRVRHPGLACQQLLKYHGAEEKEPKEICGHLTMDCFESILIAVTKS